MRKKQVRTRGKIRLSRYFQEFKKGEGVSIIEEKSVPSDFPKRLQGRTGTVEGKRGRAVIVKIKDQNKEKKFLIGAIHLIRIEQKIK